MPETPTAAAMEAALHIDSNCPCVRPCTHYKVAVAAVMTAYAAERIEEDRAERDAALARADTERRRAESAILDRAAIEERVRVLESAARRFRKHVAERHDSETCALDTPRCQPGRAFDAALAKAAADPASEGEKVDG